MAAEVGEGAVMAAVHGTAGSPCPGTEPRGVPTCGSGGSEQGRGRKLPCGPSPSI
jgi:hypothetical protein